MLTVTLVFHSELVLLLHTLCVVIVPFASLNFSVSLRHGVLVSDCQPITCGYLDAI